MYRASGQDRIALKSLFSDIRAWYSLCLVEVGEEAYVNFAQLLHKVGVWPEPPASVDVVLPVLTEYARGLDGEARVLWLTALRIPERANEPQTLELK